MAAADLSSMTPIVINSTNLPCTSITYDPGIAGQPIRHSGLDFASNYVRGNNNPTIAVQAPFAAAYNLIGTKSLAITTLEMHLTSYTGASKEAGTTKYDLAAGASAVATITGFSEGPGNIIVADIQILLLSSDGTTPPLTEETAVAIPSLSSEPDLHIRGPIVVDGTRISGVSSFSASTGNSVIPLSGSVDGDTYPRVANYRGGDRTINLGHNSPRSIIAELDHNGMTPTTSAIVYLRSVAADYVTTGSTGVSITSAACSVHAQPINQTVGGYDSSGIFIQAVDGNSDSTDPWAFNFSATLPAA